MRFANRTKLERLRSEYPVGCRIVLDEMDDPYRKMPAGLQGVYQVNSEAYIARSFG